MIIQYAYLRSISLETSRIRLCYWNDLHLKGQLTGLREAYILENKMKQIEVKIGSSLTEILHGCIRPEVRKTFFCKYFCNLSNRKYLIVLKKWACQSQKTERRHFQCCFKCKLHFFVITAASIRQFLHNTIFEGCKIFYSHRICNNTCY